MTADDLDKVTEQAQEALSAQSQLTQEAIEQVRRQPTRQDVTRAANSARGWAVVAACIAAALAIAVSVLAVRTTAQTAATEQARELVASQEHAADALTAQAAYTAAQQANQQLAAQGKPQVAVPTPQQGDSTNTLVSAAAAQVLASLPANIGQPTAQQLGAAIASYIAANPQGPTAAEIASSVSTYFAANATAFKGATGDTGTGVTSVHYDTNTGDLTITLSDGTTSGPFHIQGAQGDTGATGPAPGGWSNADGSTCMPTATPVGQSGPWYTCSAPTSATVPTTNAPLLGGGH